MPFLPATPPNTSKGEVTNVHIRTITRMVPNGKAAVALYAMATVLRKQNVKKRGPQNKQPVNNRFLTCNVRYENINPIRTKGQLTRKDKF